MRVIREDFPEFRARKVRLVLGDIQFGELDLGARIGVLFRDLFPKIERSLGFA